MKCIEIYGMHEWNEIGHLLWQKHEVQKDGQSIIGRGRLAKKLSNAIRRSIVAQGTDFSICGTLFFPTQGPSNEDERVSKKKKRRFENGASKFCEADGCSLTRLWHQKRCKHPQ